VKRDEILFELSTSCDGNDSQASDNKLSTSCNSASDSSLLVSFISLDENWFY